MSADSLLATFALLVARLETMGCPLLPKGQWTRELVYQAGPTRDKLLRWLLDRFCGVANPLPETSADEKIYREMLSECTSLGLVLPGETVDLIKYKIDNNDIAIYGLTKGLQGLGKPPFPPGAIQRQVEFLDSLSEMVLLASPCESEKLHQQHQSDVRLVGGIATSCLPSVFPNTCMLLAPDLAKLPDPPINRKESLESTLQGMRQGMETALTQCRSELELLRQSYVSEGGPDSDRQMEPYRQAALSHLYTSLLGLHSSAHSILQTYQSNWGPWLNTPPHPPSDLGPAIRQAKELLKVLLAVIESCGEIRHTDTLLKEHLTTVSQLAEQIEGGAGVSLVGLRALQRDLSTLHEALQRINSPLVAV